MFLLDTNVVSAARKRDPLAVEWIAGQKGDLLYLSVLTLGEIAMGVKRKARKDPAAADYLERWLHRLRGEHENRILSVDERVVLEWGRIAALRTRGVIDGLIAATAIVHGMTVVTRNIADFDDTGATVVNPWQR